MGGEAAALEEQKTIAEAQNREAQAEVERIATERLSAETASNQQTAEGEKSKVEPRKELKERKLPSSTSGKPAMLNAWSML